MNLEYFRNFKASTQHLPPIYHCKNRSDKEILLLVLMYLYVHLYKLLVYFNDKTQTYQRMHNPKDFSLDCIERMHNQIIKNNE
jgi:hypothetical protein